MLLSRLLDAQPDVSVREGYMAGALRQGMQFARCEAHRFLTERQRAVVHGLVRREWTLMSNAQRLPVRAEACTTLDAMHRHLLAQIAQPDDAAVGHKIHGPAGTVLAFVEQTDVRCIWLVRDARDVMLSRWFRGDDMLDGPLAEWKRSAALARRRKGQSRILVVRYEDLVRRPEHVLSDIGAMLETEVAPLHTLMTYTGTPWMENSSFADVERVLDEAPIERWKRHMQRPLVRYATWACSQELEAWGYDTRLKPPLTRNEARRFRMRWLAFQAARSAGRLRAWVLQRLFPPLGE